MKNNAIKTINLNYKEKIAFHQDNGPIHVSPDTKLFFEKSNIPLLPLPAYSPGLIIIKNVWPILSDYVYNGNTIKNLAELEIEIKETITWFNETKKDAFENLYGSITNRLLSVIIKRGERLKY